MELFLGVPLLILGSHDKVMIELKERSSKVLSSSISISFSKL